MSRQEQGFVRYKLHSDSGFGITWTGTDGRQEIGVRAIRNTVRALLGNDPLPQKRPDLAGFGILYVWPNGSYVRGIRALRNIARGVQRKDPIVFKRTMVPF